MMDNKYYTQYMYAIAKQLTYIQNKGYPGMTETLALLPDGKNFTQWNHHYIEDSNESEVCSSDSELILKLPYAGINLTARLFFNLYQPWNSPDIILADPTFMSSITTNDLQNKVPCFNNWNFMSENIIHTLVSQFLDLYREYQITKLQDNELLYFEYKSLLQTLQIENTQIEVSVTGGNMWIATFLIRLPLDLKDMPPVLCDANPGVSSCLLHVLLRKSDGGIVPKLHLSPQLEFWINTGSVSLPAVPPGSSICDYAVDIHRRLNEKVKSIVMRFEYRKQLIAQLLCNFGGCMLEYDTELFKEASFLFEHNDFNFVAAVVVSDDASKTIITVTLRSVYHVTPSTELQAPCVVTLDALNVCLTSSPQQQVDLILNHITNNLPLFKTASVQKSK